jgi:hypothetical protein
MFGRKKIKTEFTIRDGLTYYLSNRQANEETLNSQFITDFIKMLEDDDYNHIKGLRECHVDNIEYLQGKAHYCKRMLDMLNQYKRMTEE